MTEAARSINLSEKRDSESADISVVLAETYPILLEGLEHAFKAEPGFQVLACCRHADEALRAVRGHHPDVLVLDLDLPGNAMQVVREVTRAKLPTRVVLLASAINERDAIDALRFGAKGVVLKSMARHLLLQCVRKVHRGATWLERVSAGRAVERLLRGEAAQREAAAFLSQRELEVVRIVLTGRSNKEISEKLTISEGTVKIHLHHVYEKLGVKSRLELALYVRDRGLFPTIAEPSRRPRE